MQTWGQLSPVSTWVSLNEILYLWPCPWLPAQPTDFKFLGYIHLNSLYLVCGNFNKYKLQLIKNS